MGRIRTIVNGHELPDPDDLTARELRVLVCLAEGLRPADIAQSLKMSDNAVYQRTFHIVRKMKTQTSAGAVAVAFRRGIIK